LVSTLKKGLNIKERHDLALFDTKIFENIVIELQYPNQSILISNVYHSPNPPVNVTITNHNNLFLETLDAHLCKLSEITKDSYIFLDSNIDLLKLNTHQLCNDYMDINLSNGFVQLICRATRIQGGHCSLIDHILTNANQPSYDTGTILSDLSDHFINFIQLKNTKQKIKHKKLFKRSLTDENIARFKETLSHLNWADTLSKTNVDEAFDAFWKIFSDMYNIHFPQKKTRFNRNKHKLNSFMTEGLLKSRNTKINLCKSAALNRSVEALNLYKNYRNIYNSLVRLSKKMYFEQNFETHKKNPKKTWDLLKEAANLNKSNDTIEQLIINNELITDPTKIANEFNRFFVKIGVQISESILPTNAKPEDFMPIIENLTDIDLGTTNPAHICDLIKSLQTKLSLDSDGLSTKLLKMVATEISQPIAHIFNLSLTQGIFPNKFKKSRTVPVFKSGNANSCDNYRPIALLSSLSKILEKLVSVKLVNHLDFNNILYEHQYGFQKNKSTEQNLIHAVNFIGNSFNENKFCIGVFFDLKKAFDVCSHEILLMKLEKMGIKGIALNWFKSYLENRTQCVDINGHLSDEEKLKISILQGSILGPILFLCYINDLFRVSDLLTLMFADDTFTLKSDKNLNNLIQSVNTEVNKMAVWFRANKLAVNKNKTKFIIFRPKGKKINDDFPPLLLDENEQNVPYDPSLVTQLERYHNEHVNKDCRAYKLLGVFLDEYLTLDQHVNHIIKKLSRSLYCIRMAKNNVTENGMRSLYFALIHSHLSYCPVILNCLTKTNLAKLTKIQKKAIRTVTKSAYNAHTAPLFLRLKILPLDKLIKLGNLQFMHAVHYNYAPSSFQHVWQLNTNRHGDRQLRNDDLYTLPPPRIEQFKRLPLYSLPMEWNKAGDITLQENKVTFRYAVKDRLFLELSENQLV